MSNVTLPPERQGVTAGAREPAGADSESTTAKLLMVKIEWTAAAESD